MSNKKKLAMLCVAGALMVLCGTALAQNGPVGSIQLGGDSLSIMPAVPYAEMRMTISGEGVYLEEKYGPGGMAAVYTGRLPDGQYSYEIIASPEVASPEVASPEVDETSMGATEGSEAPLKNTLDQEEEKARTYIQSGSFEVVGGAMQLAASKGTDPSERSADGE